MRWGGAWWDARIIEDACFRRARFAAPALRRSANLNPRVSRFRLACANRKSLLTGTALASTLILASLLVPAPARADVTCPPGAFPPPGPIAIINPGDDISCVNVYDRTNNAGTVIDLRTNGANEFVNLYNSGVLTATNAAGNAFGIQGYTNGPSGSPVTIQNLGDITASASSLAYGIRTLTSGDASPIGIVNSGDIAVTSTSSSAFGIGGVNFGAGSPITVQNSANVTATSTGLDAFGIYTYTEDINSPMSIVNSGDIVAITTIRNARAYLLAPIKRTAPSPSSIAAIWS